MKKITVLTFGFIQVIVIYDNPLYLLDALEKHTDGYKQDGFEFFYLGDNNLTPVENTVRTVYLDIE